MRIHLQGYLRARTSCKAALVVLRTLVTAGDLIGSFLDPRMGASWLYVDPVSGWWEEYLFFSSPFNKDRNIVGSTLGPRIFGNSDMIPLANQLLLSSLPAGLLSWCHKESYSGGISSL